MKGGPKLSLKPFLHRTIQFYMILLSERVIGDPSQVTKCFCCQNNSYKANNQTVACSLVVQVSVKTSKLCQESAIKYSSINKADL